MAVGVEWPFEAVRYVAAARIACRRHRLGGLQAPLPRATDEKQFAFAIGADGIEGVVRKTLQFDHHGPLQLPVDTVAPDLDALVIAGAYVPA
jgi:hypothetical protein